MSGQRTGPWSPPDWRVRARAVLADRLSVVVAAFLLLAVVGAGVTYGAVVAPGTESETETVDEWTTTSEYHHRATVQKQNPVYPTGTQLENRSAYFTEATPVFNGSYRASYAADTGDVRAQTTLTLVLRATDEQTSYWEQTDRLARETTALAVGESMSVPFSVNVTQVRERIRRIESSLGTAGDTEVHLRAETVYRGTANGREVNETVVDMLTIQPGEQVYEVSGDGAEQQAHTRERVVQRPVDVGPVRSIGGPVLLVVSLLMAAGALKAKREQILALTTHEQAALERAEFEDWVTIGTVPDDPPGERIRVSSLEGLVDLAADTNSRIIQDQHLGHYVVFGDEYHYLYEPLGRESL